MDLRKSRLHVKCRILQGDGSTLPPVPIGVNVPDEVKVGPVNNLLSSLWSQVDVSLQQQVITPSVSTNYPYKAYIDTLLTSGTDDQGGWLQGQLFMKDINLGSSGSNDPIFGTNPWLAVRSQYFRESKIVDMEGPLYMDICQQTRLILDGIPLDIKLYPKPEPFVLISSNLTPNYNMKILEVVLKVCMVHVSPGILMGHSRALDSKPAQYFLDRSDVKTFAIPQGQLVLTVEDVFQGSCPEQLVVGLVSSAAFNGSYATNPFNFHHYKCNFAAFYLDGQTVPARPLQPDYQTGNYVDAYMTLFTGTGMYQSGKSINLSRGDYENGHTLYIFDMTQEHDQYFHPRLKKGNTRLELKFAEGLSESVTAILYAKFPAVVDIDKARRVTMSS